MAEFNPNATTVLGPEFRPASEKALNVPGIGTGYAMVLPSTGVETVDEIHLGVDSVYVGAAGTSPLGLVEIFEAGDEIPTGITSTIFRPNEDVAIAGWRDEGGGSTTIFDGIDEATLDLADYIESGGLGDDYDVRFATAAALAGQRILGVELFLVGENTAGAPSIVEVSFSGATNLPIGVASGNNTVSFGTSDNVKSETFVLTEQKDGALSDPIDIWRISDITDLDASTHVRIRQTGVGNLRVYQVYLTVHHCDENRVAVGLPENSAAGNLNARTWQNFNLSEPDGTDNWPKAAATDYTIHARQTSNYGGDAADQFDLAGLSAVGVTGGAPPWTNAAFSRPTLDARHTITALGSSTPETIPVVLVRSDAADSVDSQPYARIGGPAAMGDVDSGATWEQEISGAAAVAYGLVIAMVDAQAATADLDFAVRQRSDDAQLGGDATLTRAEWDALPVIAGSPFRRALVPLASAATLAAATQYYLDATSAEATSAWKVAVMVADIETSGSDPEGELGTYNGTTDDFTDAVAAQAEADGAATLHVQPAAPTNFDAVAGSQDFTAEGAGCSVDAIAFASLTWTATALGADFGTYEVERLGPDGLWQQIANITTESVTEFRDFEGRRGEIERYRMRVVDNLGASSVYTSQATEQANAEDCEWLLVTNEDPALNVAYDPGPFRAYNFRNTDEITRRRIYGRDFATQFGPLEQRGVSFSLPLTINAQDSADPAPGIPTSPGIPVFAPIRAIADAALSYVCVLDDQGNRFYAGISLLPGSHTMPGHRYFVTVDVGEVTDTPSTPDVA